MKKKSVRLIALAVFLCLSLTISGTTMLLTAADTGETSVGFGAVELTLAHGREKGNVIPVYNAIGADGYLGEWLGRFTSSGGSVDSFMQIRNPYEVGNLMLDSLYIMVEVEFVLHSTASTVRVFTEPEKDYIKLLLRGLHYDVYRANSGPYSYNYSSDAVDIPEFDRFPVRSKQKYYYSDKASADAALIGLSGTRQLYNKFNIYPIDFDIANSINDLLVVCMHVTVYAVQHKNTSFDEDLSLPEFHKVFAYHNYPSTSEECKLGLVWDYEAEEVVWKCG